MPSPGHVLPSLLQCWFACVFYNNTHIHTHETAACVRQSIGLYIALHVFCAVSTYIFHSPMTRKTMHPQSITINITAHMVATIVVTVLFWQREAMAACVGEVSTESFVSLKQCGELRCGTVTPHGPASTKYPPPLTVIRAFPSCLVKKLERLATNDIRSIDGSGVESLALNMT